MLFILFIVFSVLPVEKESELNSMTAVPDGFGAVAVLISKWNIIFNFSLKWLNPASNKCLACSKCGCSMSIYWH